MQLGIREKDNYKDLVSSENRRSRKAFIKCAIKSLVFSLGSAGLILLVCITISKIAERLEKIAISKEVIFFILVGFIISISLLTINALLRDKSNKDNFLNELYKYLPLDKEDINNNGLVDYIDYLYCVNRLIKEIDKDMLEVDLHERVRHDIVTVIIEVYRIDDNLAYIIRDNFEILVFRCDTKEKIKRVIEFYLKEDSLSNSYKDIIEELSL